MALSVVFIGGAAFTRSRRTSSFWRAAIRSVGAGQRRNPDSLEQRPLLLLRVVRTVRGDNCHGGGGAKDRCSGSPYINRARANR